MQTYVPLRKEQPQLAAGLTYSRIAFGDSCIDSLPTQGGRNMKHNTALTLVHEEFAFAQSHLHTPFQPPTQHDLLLALPMHLGMSDSIRDRHSEADMTRLTLHLLSVLALLARPLPLGL